MKIAKLIRLFSRSCLLSGCFLALLLAGCFNPITAIPPKSGDPVTDPFTIDIFIGKDGSARTVAGPTSNRIKTGIRNFIQLVVVDNQGNIQAFAEDRRTGDADENAFLSIESIEFGKTYHFLMLMGYWKHDGSYNYTVDEPPTLLAAGLRDQEVTGSGKITVVMWPIVVDTEFKSGSRTAAPEVNAGTPGKVSLLPFDWSVTWKVKKGVSGDGFEELVKAQKVIPANVNKSNLLVNSKPAIIAKAGEAESLVTLDEVIGNEITLSSIGDGNGSCTAGITKIGTEGTVQFKVEYVPFNLTSGEVWTNNKSKFNLDGSNVPVWIIRNGVNDDAQNTDTNFNNFATAGSTANGNGAVAYVVTADKPKDPTNPQTGDLVIRDGKFVGPSTSEVPEISFITGGYEGAAEVYYAVVGAGTKAAPLATVEKALANLNAAYESWPGKGTEPERPGAIVILDTVEVSKMLEIKGEDYPPIILSDDSVMSGGKLRAKEQIQIENGGTSLLKLTNNASVTLEGGLILAGLGKDATVKVTGVWVDGSTFTMNGGEISGNTTGIGTNPFYGGGVLVQNGGRFTMSGGKTSGNFASHGGGGVLIQGGSTFTMSGGKISGNSTGWHGGGVLIRDGSRFTMSDSGEISGNSTDFYGGGVCVGKQGTFIMSDGKISGNTAGKKKDPGNSSAGGGVYVTGQFAKTGGTIYGYDANPDNNKAVDSGGNIANNEGHAVYVKI